MKRFLLLPLALVALLCAAATAAYADTVKVTVPADLIFQYGQDPIDAGHCSALVFVRWADVPGTVSATAFYNMKTSGAPREESVAAAAPAFHDTTNWVLLYQVDPGYHWINVSKGWSDGPVANTCQGQSEKMKTIILNPVRVELQVAESAACVKAQGDLVKQQRAVKKYKAKVKHSSGQKRKSNKKKLAKAKRAVKHAEATIKKECPPGS